MFGKTKHIHFIGIGGIGMSGMAELLYKLGFTITGSDQNNSERTDQLKALGLKIKLGHSSSNINNADVIVYSSAVPLNNPEIKSAIIKNIPVIRRAEMLAELLKVKPISIAISGTHGKTTTCSMLGEILTTAKLDPTLVIGGIVNKFKSNTISGDGDLIVVEADEFDRSFLTLKPTMSIINNLDLEHLDCYKNLEDLQNTFIQFANSVPFYGRVGICIDNLNLKKIKSKIKRPIITFGMSKDANVRAANLNFSDKISKFDLLVNNKKMDKITIQLPGRHNIRNALAAITMALELDIPYKCIKDGLMQYSGVRRRFEIKYKTKNNIIIIDDYAHHPAEVLATINAAKSGWKNDIIAVFQPHLFSRTRDFYKEFASAFLGCNKLIITDIYAAREKQIKGINAKMIIDEAKISGHNHAEYIPDQEKIASRLKQIAKSNDIIITMGAGNIWRQCENIYNTLNQ